METIIEDKVLDNKIRKMLSEIGVLGFTENVEFKYVPKAFREKNEDSTYKLEKKYWAVFNLKGKDGIEALKMEDGLGHMEYDDKKNKRTYISKTGSHRITLLTDCIIGWKNWFDADGREIPFRSNGTKISSHSLKRIPVLWAIELANAITERTTLSEEELQGLDC